jgi:hypothetical protein
MHLPFAEGCHVTILNCRACRTLLPKEVGRLGSRADRASVLLDCTSIDFIFKHATTLCTDVDVSASFSE